MNPFKSLDQDLLLVDLESESQFKDQVKLSSNKSFILHKIFDFPRKDYTLLLLSIALELRIYITKFRPNGPRKHGE